MTSQRRHFVLLCHNHDVSRLVPGLSLNWLSYADNIKTAIYIYHVLLNILLMCVPLLIFNEKNTIKAGGSTVKVKGVKVWRKWVWWKYGHCVLLAQILCSLRVFPLRVPTTLIAENLLPIFLVEKVIENLLIYFSQKGFFGDGVK